MMADIEQQRDIALKIMLFFVSFMLLTFGILYLFFKFSETNSEMENYKQGILKQREIRRR